MDLTQEFMQAVAESKLLSEKPSNDVLLKIYSLYKQATEGDFNGEMPSNPFDIVAIAKANAWKEQSGKTKDEAMKQYIELIQSLKA
jgi:diazepam-binding inhibitor (GABA receptor modulating acyl-CoA-binding protein)